MSRKDKKRAGKGEVLKKMDELAAIVEIRMENERRDKAECGERDRGKAREATERDEQAGA